MPRVKAIARGFAVDEEEYSETITFSKDGFRTAVLGDDGAVTHLDNADLSIFGGVCPNVGDRITTLWDPDREDDAESYEVLARHWIGELKGDNCWWLLLKEIVPTDVERRLFKVARAVSKSRHRVLKTYADLVDFRGRPPKKPAPAKKPK